MSNAKELLEQAANQVLADEAYREAEELCQEEGLDTENAFEVTRNLTSQYNLARIRAQHTEDSYSDWLSDQLTRFFTPDEEDDV